MVTKKKTRKSVRKKTQKNKSALALQDNLTHPVQTVYHLLAMMGVIGKEADLEVRYQGTDYNVSIALPLIKYAIAFDGDNTKGLEEDGWHIEKVAYKDVEPFSRVFFAVDNARVAEMYSRADPNVKTTSIPEEKLLIEFKRRRMPEPDRNYKFIREDGSELTTPDFTWEDMNLAFFMDGSYWHSVKSDQDIIKEIKSSKKMQDSIVQKRKDKTRKDGAIRSELAARGWTVLSCTDDDITTAEGLKEIVDMVERAMNTISSVNKVVSSHHDDSSGADSIMDFLEDDDSDSQHSKSNPGTNYQGDAKSPRESQLGTENDKIDSNSQQDQGDQPDNQVDIHSEGCQEGQKEYQEEDRKENDDLPNDQVDGKTQSIIDFINETAQDSTESVSEDDDEHHFHHGHLRYDEM